MNDRISNQCVNRESLGRFGKEILMYWNDWCTAVRVLHAELHRADQIASCGDAYSLMFLLH